ncbi:MAG TPA: EAL domain-containing protein [Methylibium sp.]|nr:EAL domain-containing protein [Methylibium sp.]
MSTDRLLSNAAGPAPWTVHPSHRPAMRWVAATLIAMAIVQFAAWAIPASPGATGIAHYLPLHILMETVSIVIAMMVFAQGWNSRAGRSSGNQVLLASLFFAVGWLDFSHTAAYAGMPDFFSPNDSDKHLNFWLSARFLAAVSLLIVAVRPWDRWLGRGQRYVVFVLLCAVTAGVHWIVLAHQDWLPHLFIPGVGLTPLKIHLEYFFIALNVVTAALLWRRMRQPLAFNAPLLFGAVGAMAMSEFFFTLYTTQTGAYNVLGHAYKVVSYLFIYRAVVVEAIERPYRELELARQNLELAVRASNTGLWDWDVRSGQASFSPVWKAQLGYAPEELEDAFSTWERLLHPDDREAAVRRATEFLGSPSSTGYESEFRMRHKDGSYHWILARGEKQVDAQGQAIRLLGSHADVTERRRAEDRFRSAVEASPTGMVMVDEQGAIVLTNARTDAMFGYAPGALIGQPIEVLIPIGHRPGHAQHLRGYMEAPAERGMGEERELYARHRDGHDFRVEVGLTPIAGHAERYVIASVVDITKRVQAEQRISQLVNFDPLTGLPNRSLLNDRVTQAIGAAARDKSRLGVLFLDLDHFKHVNDTLGHRTGDQLLVDVARRLQYVVRHSDTVARIGGDEFVIVLLDAQEDAAARVATKIAAEVARPCRIGSHELVVTPSIGIAMYPEDGTDFETLYQRADTAMYRAKQDGRNDYRFFTKEMQSRTERVLVVENAMRQALERGQFHLQYQPQISMDGRRVVGVEALLRWQHPELGMVSPAEFIPLAERNGQIIPIGSWVMRSALRQLRAWMDAGLPPMVMAVNLSAVQFRHPNLPEMVTRLLDEAQLAPEYLELELTEGAAMVNPPQAIAMMDKLHACGVRMSIDDFGIGYSSLNYLKKFSVYKLKIDQTFVRDIVTDPDDRAIVCAIIQMARSLGFKTVAEGVETAAQRDFLARHGCDEVQGYLFSRPLPAEQIEPFVRAVAGEAAPQGVA